MAKNIQTRYIYSGGKNRMPPDFATIHLYPMCPFYFDSLNELRNLCREVNQFISFNSIVLGISPLFSKMAINNNTMMLMDVERKIWERMHK